jgi:hypothetical protein
MHPGDYAALKAGSQHPPEPWAIPIMEAVRLSGLSRSEIYKRMAAGQIEAIKSGSRTLVLMPSLKAHVASLPRAEFRTSRAAA